MKILWTNRAKIVLAVILYACLAACAGPAALDPSKVPPTVARVELARYQGTWYEIARMPLWFQRNCLRSQATYGLLETGEVSVLNECDTGGGKDSIRGSARVVDAKDERQARGPLRQLVFGLHPLAAPGELLDPLSRRGLPDGDRRNAGPGKPLDHGPDAGDRRSSLHRARRDRTRHGL